MTTSDLREYLRANLFDGSEDGVATVPVSVLLDDLEELIGQWLVGLAVTLLEAHDEYASLPSPEEPT